MELKYSIYPITVALLLSSSAYADPVIQFTKDKNTQTVITQDAMRDSGDLITTYETAARPTSKILTQFEIDEQKSWSRLWD